MLSAIDNHTGFTTNDYLDDMQLDQSEKPKLSRVLSELKKDGYVSSVMGEDKLLCWSLTPQGAAYVAENRKGLKLDVSPEPQYNPDDVAFKDETVTTFTVVNSASHELFDFETLSEAIEYAKVIEGGEVFELTRRKVAYVKPIKTFEVIML